MKSIRSIAKSNGRMNGSLVVFLLLAGLFCLAVPGQRNSVRADDGAAKGQELTLVWSAEYDHGEQIYISSYTDNRWSDPVQLSSSEVRVFQPTAAIDNEGGIWVVWSGQDDSGSFLEYSVYHKLWSRPARIASSLVSNKAPSLMIDRENIPWLAWTGIEQIYPDIYWSRWNGNAWEQPLKAHPDNEVPDLEPNLRLDDSGRVVLSWRTFSQGRYRLVNRMWRDGQWLQPAAGNATPALTADQSLAGQVELPALPDFIGDSRKATLYIRRGESAVSVSLSGL